jgi:hypothetical protein
MNPPTFATWLYGPIGVGVFGGVTVSTVGISAPPRQIQTLSWRA